MKRIASLLGLCCVAVLPSLAQSSMFTGYVGGGFTEPTNPVGRRLDNGWNISAGVGVRPQQHFGVMLDFMYDHNNLSQGALNAVGAPDGSMRVFAFSLNPVIRLAPRESPIDLYVTGGGGVYHRTVEFTQPTLATVTVFDPWFGFVPASVVANQVIGSFTVVKPGFNVGAGVELRVGGNAKLFAEARYHRMFITDRIDTTLLPVTFGVRW